MEKSRQHINNAIAGTRDYDAEFRVIWPDGSVHHIKANAMVMQDEQGTVIKLIGINWDVTDLINYQSELLKAKEQAIA